MDDERMILSILCSPLRISIQSSSTYSTSLFISRARDPLQSWTESIGKGHFKGPKGPFGFSSIYLEKGEWKGSSECR
jgi:hypothetical protein